MAFGILLSKSGTKHIVPPVLSPVLSAPCLENAQKLFRLSWFALFDLLVVFMMLFTP